MVDTRHKDSKEKKIGKGWEELHRARDPWSRSWGVQGTSSRMSTGGRRDLLGRELLVQMHRGQKA